MNVIHTNRDQRPKRYSLESADVADVIGSAITSGRMRQVARGYANSGPQIGWVQFKAILPDDGEFQFPFPQDHKYTQEDVDRVLEFIKNCRTTDRRYRVKLNRWYSPGDVSKLVARCKSLKKKESAGELVIPKKTARRSRVAN